MIQIATATAGTRRPLTADTDLHSHTAPGAPGVGRIDATPDSAPTEDVEPTGTTDDTTMTTISTTSERHHPTISTICTTGATANAEAGGIADAA